MPTYHFHQLDVFTTEPLTGNPLAVFPDASGLPPGTMQALAREMNLSETAFVLPSAKATRRVRFFTPTAEIPLAGHPTIGTWWLLAELGHVKGSADSITVTQETGRGVLPVDIAIEHDRPTHVSMVQPLPEFGTTVTDCGRLAELLGAASGAVTAHPPPQIVSTGIPQLMVPIAALAELRALPSGGTGGELAAFLRSVGTDCAMCFCVETEDPDATVHCRMFAPGLGVPEDPATGSASGALACYLVEHGLVNPGDGIAQVVVEQGSEIGRASRIRARVTVDARRAISEVRVGGSAVTIISGDVWL